MNKYLFTLFLFLPLLSAAQTAPTVLIRNGWSSQIVESRMHALTELGDKRFATDSILAGRYNHLFTTYTPSAIAGKESRNWLKISLVNESDTTQSLYLGTSRFEYLDFWLSTDADISHIQKSGQALPEKEKAVQLPGLSFFTFDLPKGKSAVVYLRAENKNASQMPQVIVPLTVMNEAEYHRSYERPTDYTFMFLGAIGIMAAFNLVLFFITGLRAYLFYTGYVMTVTAFILAITPQFAMQIYGHMDVTKPFVCTSGQISLMMYTLVARELTEAKQNYPKVDRFLKGIMLALAIAAVLAFYPPALLVVTVINFTSALAVYPILLTVAAVMAFRGHLPSRYFLIASMIYMTCNVTMILQLLYVLPPVMFGLTSSTLVQIGVAVELAMFSLGLGARIQEMRKRITLEEIDKERILREKEEEKKRILEEQNVLLEQKVKLRTRELAEEKEKSERLLLNILPDEIATELKQHGRVKPRMYDNVSIIFLDIVEFTKIAERVSPEVLIAELDYYFQAIDNIFVKHNVEKIKTIGDAYLAVAGLPAPDARHAHTAMRAAMDILAFMDGENVKRQQQGRPLFNVRLGIHSGSAIAGVVGNTKFAFDIWGDDVNIAARLESSGEKSRINVSETTWVLLKDDYNFEQRGKIHAKYKGEMEMYFLR